MTNDETMVDNETIEETSQDDVIQEEVAEVSDNTPTLEDYQKLQKDLKTAIAQKEHYKKKANEKKEEINKPNTTSTLTREEAILFAKGLTPEEVDIANKLSKVNGVSLLEAVEDDYVKTKIEKRKQKELSEKASLGTSYSGKPNKPPKPLGEMDEEEHRAYFRKVMGV